MTTQAWTSRLRCDDNTTFREFVAEFSARMAACGMVQTADTGQVNLLTVNRPAANTEAGYEIWTFNDSLQATAPIYIRVGYAVGSANTNPAIFFTVGTGSNGAGTITGTALTTARRFNANTAQTSDTARPSFMCHTEGFFGVSWKHGSTNSVGGFFVDRTCDNAGVKDGTGAMVHWGLGNPGSMVRQALRFASTAAAYTATTSLETCALGIMAQCPAVSSVGADYQVALGFTITPRAVPLNGVCGVYAAEFPVGLSFPATLVGSASHTYLTMAAEAGGFGPVGSTSAGGMNIAMLWE
jgi:hypothetical protein